MPESVKIIGMDAFTNCPKVSQITVPAGSAVEKGKNEHLKQD
jgi:hypothetical protein